jgi:glutathionylspermidine synthase
VLWDLFPNHPLLLETSDKPLEGKAYVEKKCFGREGENVTIYDKDKTILDQKDGEYGNFKSIYQEYVELPKIGDTSIQAGIFFAYEACGLGFRSQDRLIIEDRASFMAHIVE